MAISEKNMKILWAATAGYCSFSDCSEKLYGYESSSDAYFNIGNMAHIKGDKLGANRFDENQSEDERNSYSNLILLCPNHHTLIDKKENETRYSVDLLLDMKSKHESKIENSVTTKQNLTLIEVANLIKILLSDNHAVWSRFGPTSDLARKNPNSKSSYDFWNSERVSTIAPNNRKITNILEFHRSKFPKKEQNSISSFLLHSKSYEKWINDEISYQSVVRFPQDFATMIEGHLDAST